MMFVKVKCKNCGSLANADDFKLDTINARMVCPNCTSKSNKKEDVIEVPKKPAGWDQEDEYIERAYKFKKNGTPKFEKIEGSNVYIMYLCEKCQYKFRYNTLKHWPNSCPRCGKDLREIRL